LKSPFPFIQNVEELKEGVYSFIAPKGKPFHDPLLTGCRI